jgi:signal transduction histidine kinase
VQESLTKVMRHAGSRARATVNVVHRAGAVVVEVTDTGACGDAPPPSTVPGHGLTGMRERVTELGGELSAGPRPSGGFRVRVRLPADRQST